MGRVRRERTRRQTPGSAIESRGAAQRMAAFEGLLSDISAMFVNALPHEIDELICNALRRTVLFLGVDRGSLVVFSTDGREVQFTHDWSRPGLPLQHDRYAMEIFPWTNARIFNRKQVVFRSQRDLPRSAAKDRIHFEEAGVQSMAAIPLTAAGRVIGALAFVSIRKPHHWPTLILKRLSLLAEVFASAMARLEAAASLDERIAFEALIVEISAACVRVPGGDLDSLVTSALGRMSERLGAERVSLLTLIDDGQNAVRTHWHTQPGMPPIPGDPIRAMFPWAWGHVVERGQSMVFSSPDELPPEAVEERRTFKAAGDVRSHASVPLTIDGKIRWILVLECLRQARRWPPEILLRIRLLGEVLATALERKRAYEAVSKRERMLRRSQTRQRKLVARLFNAQEEERRRLAHDLHDAMAPELASLAMDLARVQLSHSRSSPKLRAELQRTERRLRDLSGLAHGLSRALHPAVLDDLGLSKAVESECAVYETRTGIRVAVHAEPLPAALRDGLAIGMFRILQEALRNIEKHARATLVRVRLTFTQTRVKLTIKDNGVGFDIDRLNGSPTLGLKHIAERARLLGGTMRVRSRQGHGTTLDTHAPL